MVVLRRRRNGAAASRPLANVVASPQPGAGVGVGGRSRWAACAAHHGLDSASDRGEDATTASCGAIMAAASGTLLGQARVRASLHVHTRTLTRNT